MLIAIEDFPPVAFKLGNGQTKSDREWLKKKKDYFDKHWNKSGSKILGKIEDICGDTFTNTSKQDGIVVLLHKKTPKSHSGFLAEDDPLKISLFISKNDNTSTLNALLVRMFVHSFIHQQYEFHFRVREQTLFEDILADEFVTSMVSFMVRGKKLGRANCAEALDQAVEETVFRLSDKATRSRLVDVMYKSFQEYPEKIKKRKTDILESREVLIHKLLEFLPKNINFE